MAIQVNGTEVVSNSRALNNIASVDATTAASITAAGVGGPSLASWTDLANSYTFSFTNTFPNGYDTGVLNASTILSGLPSGWKYLMIMLKTTMTTTADYANTSGTNYFRIGTSSSSYNEIQCSAPSFSSWSSASYEPPGYKTDRWGWIVIGANQDQGKPSGIPQDAFFENPSSSVLSSSPYVFATNRQATNTTLTTTNSFTDQLLPAIPSGPVTSSNNGWNTDQIQSGEGPTNISGSIASQPTYLGYRLDVSAHSSSGPPAPSFTTIMKAAYAV